jgi:hypothetical protein
MTKQETYDRVVHAIIAQGGPSTTTGAGRVCRLRGADGRVCALGALIPDAAYRPEMEDTMVSHSMAGEPQISRGAALVYAELRGRHDLELAKDLQAAHDGAVIDATNAVDVVAPGKTFDRAFLCFFCARAVLLAVDHGLSSDAAAELESSPLHEVA